MKSDRPLPWPRLSMSNHRKIGAQNLIPFLISRASFLIDPSNLSPTNQKQLQAVHGQQCCQMGAMHHGPCPWQRIAL
jgi:hypothetical protein